MKFIFSFTIMLSSIIAYSQPKQIEENMMVDSIKRSFVTYVPFITNKEYKMPLIISLHGGFASPQGQFHLADFRPIADKDKFIVICPASKHIWHDGKNNKGIDDVKFIDQLITYAIENYNVDAERVYVTGISNGGFMTSRLACQLHKRIAAVAVVAASLDVNEGYDLESPMPVIYMHGTKDKIVSYNGGKMFGREIYSQKEIIQKWVKLDGCNPKPVITNLPDTVKDSTSVIKEEYTNPNNGLKVVGYTINNGGHTWPGGWQFMPQFIVGKTTRNLNACQVIWDFFKVYKLND
ncbi:polyhydroxybutyrate depolymerase [Mucilaginibacter frigoritolerans]|jgi:polyhydroxybutyrate depolymerase|uniref:Polyhydroxybutyrate depolymerase n=1 Tax=Mucilaginibacter frigoritolerans TaxID=652788 RepID=A0A562TTD2_9SPHI|nr:prolyl oligopeptidase family serine peptidase [Mucilaginibacter frigoritolerans]TWI96356.1 polyhydroxybutyrate depolymerase [Mucilaginibacter frigoritolerans]